MTTTKHKAMTSQMNRIANKTPRINLHHLSKWQDYKSVHPLQTENKATNFEIEQKF